MKLGETAGDRIESLQPQLGSVTVLYLRLQRSAEPSRSRIRRRIFVRRKSAENTDKYIFFTQ